MANQSRLTVMLEFLFWILLYEREENGRYQACEIKFGAEPKDYGVYEYMLRSWNKLKFSSKVKVKTSVQKRIKPKRLQRLINNQVSDAGMETKAQQALKLQQEQGKLERKVRTREERMRKINESLICGNKGIRKSTEDIKPLCFCYKPICKRTQLVLLNDFNYTVCRIAFLPPAFGF